MKIESAKDYIELLDAGGEGWSNDNDALADAMEDYAKMVVAAQQSGEWQQLVKDHTVDGEVNKIGVFNEYNKLKG